MAGNEITMCQDVSGSIAATAGGAIPAHLAAPSPCAGWTAGDVLNHMIGAADMFAACARGEQRPFPDWSDIPDWAGEDPAASCRRATDSVIAAFSAPDVLGGTVTMPWGQMPATFALDLVMADHATRAWDLSRALGLTIDIPAGAALTTMQVAVTPEFRPAWRLRARAPAPSDAPTIDRLAAFTGRPL